MKKPAERTDDEIRDEYDFASMEGGVRGKYSDRLAEGTNVVVLEDDVAAAFGTDDAVNETLRAVLKAAAVIGRVGGLPSTPQQSMGSSRD